MIRTTVRPKQHKKVKKLVYSWTVRKISNIYLFYINTVEKLAF